MNKLKGKHGPYLIAEIGGNHEANFKYVKELTQLACESGADAVKFQIYTGDSLVSKVEDPDRNIYFNNCYNKIIFPLFIYKFMMR